MKNKWIILFSGAVLSLWISVGLSHNYEKNIKSFSIVNENNCEVSYEVEIEDEQDDLDEEICQNDTEGRFQGLPLNKSMSI